MIRGVPVRASLLALACSLTGCRDEAPSRPPTPLPIPRATRPPGHKVDRPTPAELLGVEVALADGVTVAAGAVLIVTVRAPGEATARLVRRVAAPLFPLRVSVTDADVADGAAELPDALEVRARLDVDGDAETSGPGDASGVFLGPAAGPEPRVVLERPPG